MDLAQEHLGVLTDAEKQEIEIWEELMASRGFEQLLRFLTPQQESVDATLANSATWDQYNYTRGFRDGLAQVLNLRNILEWKLEQVAVERMEELEERSDPISGDMSVNLDVGS